MLTAREPLDHPAGTELVRRIREIHAAIEGTTYLSRADCVDWLLDLLNSATRRSVKDAIHDQLVVFSSGNLATVQDFRDALAHIEMGLEVDAVFDVLELDEPS